MRTIEAVFRADIITFHNRDIIPPPLRGGGIMSLLMRQISSRFDFPAESAIG